MEIVSLSREHWKKWNQFCIQSDDAWFWHTTWWLEYSLKHKPELLGSSKSFFITDGSRILAICPLIVETHENQGVGHKEFSYSGSYGIAPATSNELSEKGRRKILRLLFDHIDSLAMNNHVERMSLRCSPLSPSYSIASAPQSNWLMRYNLMDVSLNTQVIDLDDGDLLYIPKKLYHRVDTLSPRISISFHFKERHGKPYKREEWYDWIGEISNGRPR